MKVEFYLTIHQLAPHVMARQDRSFSDAIRSIFAEPIQWLKHNAPDYKADLSESYVHKQISNAYLTFVFDIPGDTQAIYFKMAWPQFTTPPVVEERTQPRPATPSKPSLLRPYVLDVAYPGRMLDRDGQFKPQVAEWIEKRKAKVALVVHDGYSRITVNARYSVFVKLQEFL